MSRTHLPRIRALLRAEPEGLTIRGIADELGITPEVVRNCMFRMPDAYIDRWDRVAAGPYSAVWCVVVPPPNCPKPER